MSNFGPKIPTEFQLNFDQIQCDPMWSGLLPNILPISFTPPENISNSAPFSFSSFSAFLASATGTFSHVWREKRILGLQTHGSAGKPRAHPNHSKSKSELTPMISKISIKNWIIYWYLLSFYCHLWSSVVTRLSSWSSMCPGGWSRISSQRPQCRWVHEMSLDQHRIGSNDSAFIIINLHLYSQICS